jgi:hypothetical protein
MKKIIFLLFTLLFSVTMFAQEVMSPVVEELGTVFEKIEQPIQKEMQLLIRQNERESFPSVSPSKGVIFFEGFEGTTGSNLPTEWTTYRSGGTLASNFLT